jgi:CheY-like chemotaxis protein
LYFLSAPTVMKAGACFLPRRCFARLHSRARSVREALDILDQWQPDVLVSDISMPDEDGYGLIRQVRALPAESGGQIPAVALTGYASDKDATRARHVSALQETVKLLGNSLSQMILCDDPVTLGFSREAFNR